MRCSASNCTDSALNGKSHCLIHHKEQSNYAYGLDLELQQKWHSKYDKQKEQIVREWIEAVTHKKFASDDLGDALKNGVLLCELINTIWPNSIARIQVSSMPFVQRENIAAYLHACKHVAKVRDTDLFMTEDLFEKKNLVQVLTNILALGECANKAGFKGPQLVVSRGSVQSAAAPVQRKQPVITPSGLPDHDFGVTEIIERSNPAVVEPRAAEPAARSRDVPLQHVNPQVMFCTQCGTQRTQDMNKFCGECGQKY